MRQYRKPRPAATSALWGTRSQPVRSSISSSAEEDAISSTERASAWWGPSSWCGSIAARIAPYRRSRSGWTIHTGHGPGAIVSGQTLVAKTRGDTVAEAVIVPRAMLAVTLGDGARAEGQGQAPGTRSKIVAMLRAELDRIHGEQRAG